MQRIRQFILALFHRLAIILRTQPREGRHNLAGGASPRTTARELKKPQRGDTAHVPRPCKSREAQPRRSGATVSQCPERPEEEWQRPRTGHRRVLLAPLARPHLFRATYSTTARPASPARLNAAGMTASLPVAPSRDAILSRSRVFPVVSVEATVCERR